MATIGVKGLLFDVFGTVVDWRGSIIREGEEWNRSKSQDIDWAAFADAWRGSYRPSMERVRRGELPWTNLDALHRMSLEELLVEFGLEGLDEEEKDRLNRVWHRLEPWPDAVPGLARLKQSYLISTLSNGNVALLANMAKNAGLPWDCILSAELVRAYKPDPRVYQQAAEWLGLPPQQVLMVAAHPDDLQAAAEVGLKTAFVLRPMEHGPGAPVAAFPDPAFDLNAHNFLELAAQLEA